jgi:shikimate dehydrogenase
MQRLTGNTKVYFIIADPVAQVRTHIMFSRHFSDNGMDCVFAPLHIKPEDLGAAMAAFRGMRNLGGFVATVPHKKAVTAYCARLGETAELVGAANVIRREEDGSFSGDMVDGKGFVAGLQACGHQVADKRILLLGAGGAGSAIALALLQARAAALTIHDREQSRAEDILARLRTAMPEAAVRQGEADTAGCDMVINATGLGMRETDPLPIAETMLRPGMLAAELIMQPEETSFLRAARKQGAAVHYGRHMLEGQKLLMAGFLRMEQKPAGDSVSG